MIARRSTVSPLLRLGLRFIGAWPDAPHIAVYRLIFMSSILIVQYFQYLYVFTHLRLSELANLVDCLPLVLDCSLTVLKLTILWMRRRAMHQILTAMDNDWRECVNIERQLYAMTVTAGVSHFSFNVMMSLYTMAGIFYLLGNYALRFLRLVEVYNDTLRQLPIRIQFPFDTEQSPIFELLVVILILHVMLDVYTVAILNSLIFTLVLHVSGQIDIICQEFKIIFEKSKTPFGSFAPTLGMLIEKHNRVISFSKSIDKLFSLMAFMQVIWNTLIICSLGFFIMISFQNEAGTVTLARIVLAYFAKTVEVFIVCFAGEYMSLKSKSIADAAYESLWYNMPLDQGKIISFMIMRSQRQLTITAGKITNLSLEVFMSIMKASASYMSVLYAMY